MQAYFALSLFKGPCHHVSHVVTTGQGRLLSACEAVWQVCVVAVLGRIHVYKGAVSLLFKRSVS
jgi:hypothetical protein